jgi:hypothetical protein
MATSEKTTLTEPEIDASADRNTCTSQLEIQKEPMMTAHNHIEKKSNCKPHCSPLRVAVMSAT